MICTGLSIARDEILWYFNHYETNINGSKIKKTSKKAEKAGNTVHDIIVSEMISTVIEIRKKVYLNKNGKTVI